MRKTDKDWEWLYRGVAEIFPSQEEGEEETLEKLCSQGRPLRVKLGIDPTGADLHLGHSIAFRKLRAFQDKGHIAVVIIGDFTARIGDPTGKDRVRKQLTEEEVKRNAETYLDQLKPILDFDTPGRLEIHYNSQWLSRLNLAQILEMLSTMTVQQMLAKEGFNNRYAQQTPIYLHEFLYPLMQGYDSVVVQADVELGGTDQKFNIAVGRDLQRHFGQKPQFGVLLPILIGTDGQQKMSKSLNNYVGLREDPLSMYSKLEKIPDALIPSYFELLTDFPLSQIPDNPREAQKLLALTITAQYHGEEAAKAAQQTALSIVWEKNMANASAVPQFSLKNITFPAKLFYILSASGLVNTSGEGKRQILGGSIRLDGERITDPNTTFDSPHQLHNKILQLGKKKFVRLVWED